MGKNFLIFFLLLSAGSLLMPKKASAASLALPKDTISTSRPSASAPVSANVAANAASFSFDDNGSKYLASDSAKLFPDTGETLDTVTIASMSGTTVYLATKPSNTHHKGIAAAVPITAKHTVSFTTVNQVASNGKIKVIFSAGDTTNAASPSASGFSFNGLGSNNLSVSGVTCGSWTVTQASGLVQCNLNVAITAPTAITITIGAGTSGPVLINPTKTAAAGTADTWTVQIKITDNGDIEIDSAKVKIGTIESVQVYATVDPTLTFTIAGLTNGQAVNTGNTGGCTNTETINAGFNSTTTEVNLGVLGSSAVNISGQLLSIATNGQSGYVLTATSSGHLIDHSIGYWIADVQGTPTANETPSPAFFTAGTIGFGIHPCGQDVTTGTWGSGATGGGANAKYANPSPDYYYTLASDSTGPIINDGSDGKVTVEYAGTVSTAVPAGTYKTVMTYVVTPTF